MKALVIFTALIFTSMTLFTSTAQASPWTQIGDRKHERYEHKFEVNQHKRNTAHSKNARSKKTHKHAHHNQHSRQHFNQQGKRFQEDNYKRDRSGKKDYRPRAWQTIAPFRGRTGKDVTRYLGVEDRVQALSIQGTKRAMYIRKAYALMGNGRWVRLRGLEGYVGHGEIVRHRLKNARYVQHVALDIEPARHKRGYAKLMVRPA